MTAEGPDFLLDATTRQPLPRPETDTATRPELALVVVHSPDAPAVGRSIPLNDDLVVIGRDVRESNLCLRDGQLSRSHFRVAFDGRAGTHRLGDAGSRNGTYVDGKRTASETLRDGSVIRAGETVFVCEVPNMMGAVLARAARLAATDLTLLVLGETGTGKEKLARHVHEQSRRGGRFVALNCAALPRDVAAAELFGHTRGAFSSAITAREGLFATAAGGTLLLDEIGDLPLDVQGFLLRALQERRVRPLGSDREIEVDARVVAATHVDLAARVSAGTFRADLLARLTQGVIRLPPLRRRRSAIPSLVSEFAAEAGSALRVSADAMEALVRHEFPLNVRELHSLVRSCVATDDGELDFDYLTREHEAIVAGFRDGEPGGGTDSDTGASAHALTRRTLEALLTANHGNVSLVASELGRPRASVYRRLEALGLSPERFRRGR